MQTGFDPGPVCYSPFTPLHPPKVRGWLSEGGLRPRFSPVWRAYYRWGRRLMPLQVRQALQRRVWAKVTCRRYFIDPEMVDWVFSQEAGRRIARSLYPDDRHAAVVLTHDVESGEGLRRVPEIAELEERLGFRSSWNIVPYKYPVERRILERIGKAGHEVGVHGYNHDGRLFWSEAMFRRRAAAINRALAEWGAVGFRAPMVHRHPEWMQQLDVLYDASYFDYDPYQPLPGGVKSIWPFRLGRFVELPYTLPQDHTLFIVLECETPDLWIRKAEWLYRHHGVILLITHPDYLTTSRRLDVYAEFLRFLKGLPNVWYALPRELAGYWKSRWWSDGSPEMEAAT